MAASVPPNPWDEPTHNTRSASPPPQRDVFLDELDPLGQTTLPGQFPPSFQRDRVGVGTDPPDIVTGARASESGAFQRIPDRRDRTKASSSMTPG